jgi:hypothetical protein
MDILWIVYIPEWYLKQNIKKKFKKNLKKTPQIPVPTDIRKMPHYRNADGIKRR